MFHEAVYSDRINKLKSKLEPNTLYLFSNPSHIAYFTGFQFLVPSEREAFFVCSDTIATIIHTSFAPINNFNFLEYMSGTFPSQIKYHLEKIIRNTSIKKILYDAQTLYVAELDSLGLINDLSLGQIEADMISQIMRVKDKDEIALISQACKITFDTYTAVHNQLQVGMTELEVSQLINSEFKNRGITELAFPTIVAFGMNAAKPHHQPGDEKLENNSVVLIDMGAKFSDYCADMTRTIWFGNAPSNQFKKIEKIVQDAYTKAVQKLANYTKETVLTKDVDNAARIHISNQGFGDHFIHTTGHGLGLNIHEAPSLNWQNSDPILKNMAITIEPGIYIEGDFGYRYENTILTTKDGYEILTRSENSENDGIIRT